MTTTAADRWEEVTRADVKAVPVLRPYVFDPDQERDAMHNRPELAIELIREGKITLALEFLIDGLTLFVGRTWRHWRAVVRRAF